MIPTSFDYTRPSTVDEAVSTLRAAGEDAKILAGGQSLIPVLRLRLAAPSTLIDLGGISDLVGIRSDGDSLVIGAMTSHAEVAASDLVRQHAPMVAEAAQSIGDPQVRHMGTFGGSLSHADPAGDLPSVALALDAAMVVAGPEGRREVAAGDFFTDHFTTVLGADEILVEVRVPKLAGWGMRYVKFNRVAQAWAIVGVAAAVRRDNGGIAEARVALTNMGPTPIRARGVEQALAGADADLDALRAACETAAEGASPSSDVTASAEYRGHLAKVLSRRAVAAAAGL
ncbi:MAG: xanthine dehydrogenase family protein subunit M [Micromonosporaceae bacterium]|nr:xanthine dehydrogenase family protein subunit M [Micromonosporaceae bacterium]